MNTTGPESQGCEPHWVPPGGDDRQISDITVTASTSEASSHWSVGYDITVDTRDITEMGQPADLKRASCRDDVMPWRSDPALLRCRSGRQVMTSQQTALAKSAVWDHKGIKSSK